MAKFNKKRMIIFGGLLISVVLFSVAITYAFFAGTLGESKNEVVKIQAGTMELVFSDNDTLGNIDRKLNFGDTVEKELKIENSGTLDAYAKISWSDLTNTFTEGSLTYTLEYKTSESGTYQPIKLKSNKVPVSRTASKQLIVDYLEIPSGTAYIYKITITYNNLDVDQTSDLNATFRTKFTLDEGSESLISTIAKSAKSSSTLDFATAATTDETADGLYALEDDYGTSYYYRGAVENNYVKFGKNKDGQDMYWRIIRFNGDGSARLIYDGTQAFANGTADDSRYAITNQPWNMKKNDAKYVGWMFGGADGEASTSIAQAQRNETDSDIKEKVDKWYVDNIQSTGYSKYLTDAIFCNDRSMPDNTGGYGNFSTVYGPFKRYRNGNPSYSTAKTTDVQPTFKCVNMNDAFTLKSNVSPEVARSENKKVVGNKALTYPVGLITADEIVTAGSGVGKLNSNYYLYKSSNYYGWTISPYYNSGIDHYSRMFIFSTGLNDTGLGASLSVAPAINLAAEYVNSLLGQGTISEPYELSMNP